MGLKFDTNLINRTTGKIGFQPTYQTNPGANFVKNSFAVQGNLNHPVMKSDFTQDQLLGAPVVAQFLDVLS